MKLIIRNQTEAIIEEENFDEVSTAKVREVRSKTDHLEIESLQYNFRPGITCGDVSDSFGDLSSEHVESIILTVR